MNGNEMKNYKVFDTADMPKEINEYFLETYDQLGNDSFIRFTVDDDDYDDGLIASNWMKTFGAKKYEKVIVLRWW